MPENSHAALFDRAVSKTAHPPLKIIELHSDSNHPDQSPGPAALDLRLGTAGRFAHAWAFDHYVSPSHVHGRQKSRSTADAVAVSRLGGGRSARRPSRRVRSRRSGTCEPTKPRRRGTSRAQCVYLPDRNTDAGATPLRRRPASIFCRVYRAAIARPSCASANPGWSCSARRKLSLARDRSPSRRYVQPRPLCRPAHPGCAATPF